MSVGLCVYSACYVQHILCKGRLHRKRVEGLLIRHGSGAIHFVVDGFGLRVDSFRGMNLWRLLCGNALSGFAFPHRKSTHKCNAPNRVDICMRWWCCVCMMSYFVHITNIQPNNERLKTVWIENHSAHGCVCCISRCGASVLHIIWVAYYI